MMETQEEGGLPTFKIRAAQVRCMKDPARAKYYNEAPAGAREYIAWLFFLSVYPAEVDPGRRASYQASLEVALSKDDLLYLATHEPNPEAKQRCRELYMQAVNAEKPMARAATERLAAETTRNVSPAPAPAAPFSVRPLEDGLSDIRAEVRQLRKLVAELSARESTLPGALTLGALALLLAVFASVTPKPGDVFMLASAAAAALFSLSASMRASGELKPARVGGAVLAGLALLGVFWRLFVLLGAKS